MTSLGPAFLRLYYRSVLEYPAGVLRVALVDGRAAGFVAGFRNPAVFYRHLRRRRLQLALAALLRLARSPRLLPRLLRNYRRTGGAAAFDPLVCELSSIAVLPSQQGLSLGRALVDDFAACCGELRAATIVLTTDAEANQRTNRFYLRYGFRLSRTFLVRDRPLNEYTLELPAPVARDVLPCVGAFAGELDAQQEPSLSA